MKFSDKTRHLSLYNHICNGKKKRKLRNGVQTEKEWNKVGKRKNAWMGVCMHVVCVCVGRKQGTCAGDRLTGLTWHCAVYISHSLCTAWDADTVYNHHQEEERNSWSTLISAALGPITDISHKTWINTFTNKYWWVINESINKQTKHKIKYKKKKKICPGCTPPLDQS